MNSVKSNNLSWHYEKFTPLGFKDIGIRQLESVAKTEGYLEMLLKIEFHTINANNKNIYICIH